MSLGARRAREEKGDWAIWGNGEGGMKLRGRGIRTFGKPQAKGQVEIAKERIEMGI